LRGIFSWKKDGEILQSSMAGIAIKEGEYQCESNFRRGQLSLVS
jgi:hypothetical protein